MYRDVLQLDYGHHQCAPDDNRSRFVHQPLIVRINFEGGHLKTKFERHKHREFSVHQFPSIQAKNAFDAFNQRFQSIAFTVVHFRRQQETRGCARLTILFINQSSKDELLKVHVRLRNGDHIRSAICLGDFSHFTLQTAQFTQRELHMRKFLTEFIINFLLQVRRTHVVDHRRHVR